jgi:NAD(P)-dependent dehydrogenase (short-subunit alcohol dehydrogenase family)
VNTDGAIAVVTGGAEGIGRAIADHLLRSGASVVLADLDADRVHATVERLGFSQRSLAFVGDVSDEETLRRLLKETTDRFGPIDVFAANAGTGGLGGIHVLDEEWALAWNVNLMAHVRAVRLLIEGWLERGRGYFVATASAAGLLTQLDAAPYVVSKHAAVAFAEWVAITYGDRGVGVSCLCPMGVDTKMYHDAQQSVGAPGARAIAASGPILSADEVGRAVVEAITEERFLVLPHPEVAEYLRRKTNDYDRWLAGMRRLQARVK